MNNLIENFHLFLDACHCSQLPPLHVIKQNFTELNSGSQQKFHLHNSGKTGLWVEVHLCMVYEGRLAKQNLSAKVTVEPI